VERGRGGGGGGGDEGASPFLPCKIAGVFFGLRILKGTGVFF
jgi:hypothetical protein